MPLILLAIVILFHWKLTLTDQFTWLEDPDRANQVLPWFQFQAIQWHGFRIPAWDPNGWTGQPLFGQGQPGAAYPLNWLMFLMPMQNGHINMAVLNWYFVLLRYIAALGCYLLCRDLKCSRWASILGGCVFGLGGFVANTGWPQMVNGAIWAPYAFLFLFRVDRGENRVANSLLSGFFLGFAWLSGHHQAPLFLTLAAIALWLRMAWREARIDISIVRLAALSLAIALMAGAFQTFPMAEYGNRSVRWVGTPEPLQFQETTPYYVHEQYSLKPLSLLSVFLAVPSQWNPFIGIVALLFVVLGALLAWRERHARWLAFVAGGGMLFALGPNGFLHGLLYSIVPMVEKSRSSAAAIIVFALGVSPLAAIGLDRVLQTGKEVLARNEYDVWLPRAIRILCAFAGVLILASIFFFAAGVNPAIVDNRMLITAIAALCAAGLLAGWRAGSISARGGAIFAVFLVLFELSNVTNYNLPQHGSNYERTPILQKLFKHDDIARFLRERADGGRVEYAETDIPYNFGDWFGVETFQSYTASVVNNLWHQSIFDPHVRRIMGIRYLIAKQPARPDQQLVFKGESGLNVYETPSVFPRAWAVHEAVSAANADDGRDKLSDPNFDARSKAILVGNNQPKLDTCPAVAETVAMTVHGANRVAMQAKLACTGLVILTDTYYPGWKATVDGQSANILEVDGAFRGIVVPAGDHTLEMKYRPTSVMAGGLLTLLASFVAAGAWVKSNTFGRSLDPFRR
ncbi:MAG: YfhO family protein [Bryobacteraceae bacterium]